MIYPDLIRINQPVCYKTTAPLWKVCEFDVNMRFRFCFCFFFVYFCLLLHLWYKGNIQ